MMMEDIDYIWDHGFPKNKLIIPLDQRSDGKTREYDKMQMKDRAE